MSRKTLAFFSIPFLLLAACESEPDLPPPERITTPTGSVVELPYGEPRIDFDTATVAIEAEDTTHRLNVEVAEDDRQRARGLMYRPHLPEEAGMLFTYDEYKETGFWMLNTWIPLDIAFIDSDGEIVDILRMQPCPRAPCPTYAPEHPYRWALEVNRGYFEARGIGPGDRVRVVEAGDGDDPTAGTD